MFFFSETFCRIGNWWNVVTFLLIQRHVRMPALQKCFLIIELSQQLSCRLYYSPRKSTCPYVFLKNLTFAQHLHNLIKHNPIKHRHARNPKDSGCQKCNQVKSDRNRYISIVKKLICQKNQPHPHNCSHNKINDPRLFIIFLLLTPVPLLHIYTEFHILCMKGDGS